MGISGKKVKQRIPNDPRNLSWADGTLQLQQLSVHFISSPLTFTQMHLVLAQHIYLNSDSTTLTKMQNWVYQDLD
jgi:hypothetical protein